MEINSGFAYKKKTSTLELSLVSWEGTVGIVVQAVISTWQIQFKWKPCRFLFFIKTPFLSSTNSIYVNVANDSQVLQMIITRLLEKLQEKIWQAANKQALSGEKKKKPNLSAVQIWWMKNR